MCELKTSPLMPLFYENLWFSIESRGWQMAGSISNQAQNLVRSIHPDCQQNNQTHTRIHTFRQRWSQMQVSAYWHMQTDASHSNVSLGNRANGPGRWAERNAAMKPCRRKAGKDALLSLAHSVEEQGDTQMMRSDTQALSTGRLILPALFPS